MSEKVRNSIEFRVWGRYALFTDPLTRIGGEKCSYHVPTYEALKGIVKSIYWKPTLVWVIDEARVMRRIQTQTKGTKPLNFDGVYPSAHDSSKKQTPINTLAIYTFLADVEYQVRAHFEWNLARPELEQDRDEHKHHNIARRMLERGGRQDIFLGTRDCQGYVEPCVFGSRSSALDETPELAFGMMFHGFDYPDETGRPDLEARLWRPTLRRGVLQFPRPEACEARRLVRPMSTRAFGLATNLNPVGVEEGRVL